MVTQNDNSARGVEGMIPPSKKELVILGSVTIIATIAWLWIQQPGNLHDVLLVLLSGVSGITGTLFIVGLVNRSSRRGSPTTPPPSESKKP